MASSGQPCDWTADPGNKIVLVAYFKTIKDKIGQGGSWDRPSLESAAAHMVSHGPPAKGAPKNVSSVKGVWAGVHYCTYTILCHAHLPSDEKDP
jgi:hypothetical protein